MMVMVVMMRTKGTDTLQPAFDHDDDLHGDDGDYDGDDEDFKDNEW